VSDFTLSTSGEVYVADALFPNKSGEPGLRWHNLDAFTQWSVGAVLKAASLLAVKGFDPCEDEDTSAGAVPLVVAFGDLAPETLARIMADCARCALRLRYVEPSQSERQRELGAMFWRDRQRGLYGRTFPPLMPTLGDDGRVYLREGAQ
jgi:hypothetical protein